MVSKAKIRAFNKLMPNRVREVLLVSSPYDAFVLQEEGNLTEQIFLEYKELSLSSSPHVNHFTDENSALEALSTSRFDLVLAVARMADMDLIEFAGRVKQLRADLPVVVLGFDNAEMTRLRAFSRPDIIDAVFLWSGDAKILLAIIKDVEDRKNLDNDIAVADVRLIMVVEDSIRYYSAFLSSLYPELMKQSQSLFSEGANRLQRLLRMRTRPKIIHAIDFEQAMTLYEKYQDNLLAVVTDVGFSRGGIHDSTAGLTLVKRIRADHSDLPILVQSADEKYAAPAGALGTLFVNKNSPSLIYEARQFLTNYLGFGAFIFRLPTGEEVGRAYDIRELAECIRTVPASSLEFHTKRNHVSNWLMARSEFDLAAKLRPQKVSDFASIEEVRRYLLLELERVRRDVQSGVITDFSRTAFDPESLFQRMGDGSMGGKARGLAFLNSLLSSEAQDGMLAGLTVQIPQSFALTTDAFDHFLEDNRLHSLVRSAASDSEIQERFLMGRFSPGVEENLAFILDQVQGPLAVRSSSMLEDDMLHPFAGIYNTVMLANNSGSLEQRLFQLEKAIKIVYASCFFQNAKAYIQNTAHRADEEKMAVVIQRLVGQQYGRRFYPHLSGVAHSYNYYPLGPLTPEDGVVELALGLGRMVVDGGDCLRFSPRHPAVLPQFASPSLVLKNSQRSFYALDLDRSVVGDDTDAYFKESATRYDLEAARQDGTLSLVGSVYDVHDQVIKESHDAQGLWVVTFNNLLKHQVIPLAPALSALLDLATDGMGTAVELEFALDVGDWGKAHQRGQERRPPVLYALQMRPILVRDTMRDFESESIETRQIICRSNRSLGHGRYDDIRDVVYVKNECFDPSKTQAIAQQVGQMNERLQQEGRSYVLIGPGRWGSSDHWLGIPVQWSQISSARIIVEASPAGYNVDPSQGTHFFHNLTSLRLGYLTIPPGAIKGGTEESFVDWEWLQGRPTAWETEYLRWVRSETPLAVELDGRRGTGVVAHRE